MNKPDSFILQTVARFAFFAINAFALYLLLRGHNFPGGGFIAGLTSAMSLVLLSRGMDLGELHHTLRWDPVRVAGGGLLLAGLTPVLPMLWGDPFFEHYDGYVTLPLVGEVHLTTTLLFDIGVFLVVVGVTTKLIFVLAYSTLGYRAFMLSQRELYSSALEQPIEEEKAADELQEAEAVLAAHTEEMNAFLRMVNELRQAEAEAEERKTDSQEGRNAD